MSRTSRLGKIVKLPFGFAWPVTGAAMIGIAMYFVVRDDAPAWAVAAVAAVAVWRVAFLVLWLVGLRQELRQRGQGST